MKKVLIATLLFGATAALAANSYRVELYKPISVNGIDLKAGECKLEVADSTAVFKQGKKIVEVPVRVEQGTQKFLSTTVSVNEDSNQPQEIRLAGTTMKLIFGDAAAQAAKKTGETPSGSN